MSRLKKLQDRDAAITAEMRKLSDTLAAENRAAMTDEETATFEALKKESKDVQAALKVEADILEAEKRLVAIRDRNADTDEERLAKEGKKVEENLYPERFGRVSSLRCFKGPDAEKAAYRFGKWFLATLGNQGAIAWCSKAGIQLLAQSEGVNSQGGYLVPDEFSRTIIDLRETYGVFRRNARVIPMGSDTLLVPRRVSGLTAYFVAENAAITESDKVWGQVQLIAKKLATLTRYSSELDEDAIISIADDLASEIAYAFALKEDQSGFIGDGTSTYGGIVGVAVAINDGTHTASVVGAISGNISFETLDLEDFEAVLGKLPQYAIPNAKWFASQYGFAASMARLAYAGGGNTVTQIGGGVGPSFLGYPVVISQVLNSAAGSDVSKIKVLFGDLRLAAMMGERRGITIATSSERYFDQDQLAIRGTERIDINVHDLGDNTTPGPIIALKSAAS